MSGDGFGDIGIAPGALTFEVLFVGPPQPEFLAMARRMAGFDGVCIADAVVSQGRKSLTYQVRWVEGDRPGDAAARKISDRLRLALKVWSMNPQHNVEMVVALSAALYEAEKTPGAESVAEELRKLSREPKDTLGVRITQVIDKANTLTALAARVVPWLLLASKGFGS